MIHTDGTATVANRPSAAILSRQVSRKRAAILRAWASARSAYPEANRAFITAEVARELHTPQRVVLNVVTNCRVPTVDWREAAQYHVTDIADDDSAGRANLH